MAATNFMRYSKVHFNTNVLDVPCIQIVGELSPCISACSGNWTNSALLSELCLLSNSCGSSCK